MALEVIRQDNKFKVITQGFSTEFIPDTEANRKTLLVVLGLMEDENGNKLFTFKDLSQITMVTTSEAAMIAFKQFKKKASEFDQMYISHKKKLNENIIEIIKEIVKQEPLATLEDIAREANKQLNRTNINRWDIEWILSEYVQYYDIRKIITKRLEKGEYNYKEEYVLNRLFEIASKNGQKKEVAFIPAAAEQKWKQAAEPITENMHEDQEAPDSAKQVFTGEVSKEKLHETWQGPMGWYMWAFILYFNGVSLSVIGRWLGFNKSTVCRWLTKISNWSKSYLNVNNLIKATTHPKKVAIDEKWIYIDGVAWYLFAAVDCITNYPLHVAIYPSNSIVYCKLFLLELKNKGYYPKTIITDGWDAYVPSIAYIFPDAEHLLCRFHAIKRLFWKLRYLAKIKDFEIYKAAAKLFKTLYKRTVLTRLQKFSDKLEAFSADFVLDGLKKKMPTLLKAVGSTWRPSTSNAVESFFSHFERFYRLKGPFPDQEAAQKHLQLFMLGYLFTIGANWQSCPLEKVGYDVAKIPFYHLLNRPNAVAFKQRMAA